MKYLVKKIKCPKCRGGNIDAEELKLKSSITILCHCNDCGSPFFTSRETITGYKNTRRS